MTMRSSHTITCRACGRQQEFVVWETLNATLNPELKQRLLAGDLNTFVCDGCGDEAEVVYSMLYHDMTQHFMVWLLAEGGELPDLSTIGQLGGVIGESMRSYRLRTVGSRNELVEKVLLFDSDFDDREMELFKLALVETMRRSGKAVEGTLLFAGTSDPPEGRLIRFVLLHETGRKALAVPWDEWDRVAPGLASLLPEPQAEAGKWLRVDEAYARALM